MIFIDPGVHMCGVARFTSSGNLDYAEWLDVPDTLGFVAEATTNVTIEVPRIYPSAQQKGRLNDLLDLAFSAGYVASCANYGHTVIYPRDWKGTVNADAMTERIIEVAKARHEFEVPILPSAASKHHNVWDAVGMGYHHFGYLNQKKIFRGGEDAKR